MTENGQVVRLLGWPVDQVIDRPLSIQGQGYRHKQYLLTARDVLLKSHTNDHRQQTPIPSHFENILNPWLSRDFPLLRLLSWEAYPSAYPSWPSANIFRQGFSVSAKGFAIMPSQILRPRDFIMLMLSLVVPGSRTSPAAPTSPGPR